MTFALLQKTVTVCLPLYPLIYALSARVHKKVVTKKVLELSSECEQLIWEGCDLEEADNKCSGVREIIERTIVKFKPIFPDSRWRNLRISSTLYFVFLSNIIMCCWVSTTIQPSDEHICYEFGMIVAVCYLFSILFILIQEDTWRSYLDFAVGKDLLSDSD